MRPVVLAVFFTEHGGEAIPIAWKRIFTYVNKRFFVVFLLSDFSRCSALDGIGPKAQGNSNLYSPLFNNTPHGLGLGIDHAGPKQTSIHTLHWPAHLPLRMGLVLPNPGPILFVGSIYLVFVSITPSS